MKYNNTIAFSTHTMQLTPIYCLQLDEFVTELNNDVIFFSQNLTIYHRTTAYDSFKCILIIVALKN